MDYISSREAAEYIGMSYDFTMDRLRCGDISGYKVGKNWKTTHADLDKYMQTCRKERVYSIGKLRRVAK